MADVRTQPAAVIAPSAFDELWSPEMHPITSSREAVRAAVVSIAKDMEFIGRGGVLMPEAAKLKHFIKNCVPHIVRGEYIDSYFVNQEYGKSFLKLRGRGFVADEASITEALHEIEPIYDAIFQNLSGHAHTEKKAATVTVSHQGAPINSHESAIYIRFNYLVERFGIDVCDVVAQLREGLFEGNKLAKELVIIELSSEFTPSIERLCHHAGFVKRGSQWVLHAHTTREMLQALANALRALANPSPQAVKNSH